MKYRIWNSIGKRVNSWALCVVKFISVILLSGLFLVGFLFSYRGGEGVRGIINIDPIPMHLLGILGIVMLAGILIKLPDKWLKFLEYVFLTAVFFRYIDAGKELIKFGESGPTADQFTVYRLGELFSINEFGAIQPTSGTYLSFYPHQLGIIFIFEMIFRICTMLNVEVPVYEIIKNINIYAACVLIFCQSKIVKNLFDSVRAELMYIILMMFNVPLILYTSYVYGEILSMCFFSLGLWLLIRHHKNPDKKLSLVFSIPMFVISVVFRKNSIILCIAVGCVLAVKGFSEKRKRYFVYLLILFMGAINILPVIRYVYEYRAGNTLLDGVPSIAWIAMGMQEDIHGTKGVYNGYNYNTLEACNMDRELMIEICKRDMKERITYFLTHPREGLDFYWEKTVHGWMEGTYSGRNAIASAFIKRPDIMEKLTAGEKGRSFEDFCNGYQTVIYLGGVLFWIKERKSKELMKYIIIIAVMGGFFFHILWEMNPRYIMPYVILLTMNSAVGIVWLAERIMNSIKKTSGADGC